MSEMELKTWGGAWGIPSIDPVCLSAITYGKFSLAPVLETEATPSQTITGCLPELELDEMVYSDLFSIIGIFRREGYNADYNLTPRQQADTLAFLSYIERKLKPAVLFALWLDPNNYTKVTRPAYSKLFGFPRNFWSPGKQREKIENYISHCGSFKKKTVLEIEKILYKEARECLDILEQKLGKQKYFFGERPTTIDAACYGHLAILLNAPLLSTEIKNYLNSCEKLKNHCHRIEKFFVKRNAQKTPEKKKSSEKVDNQQNVDRKLPNKDTVITLGIGVSLMVMFAVVQGIFTSNSSLLARQLQTASNK